MAMTKPLIEVDIREFKKSATKFIRNDYPEVVANFAGLLAGKVQSVERHQIKGDLNLKSGFIPKNINAFPKTKGQYSKVKRDVKTKHHFNASVSGSERIGFMTGHNDTATRKTTTTWRFGPARITGRLAVPSHEMADKKYQTKTGKVKKKYYPVELMKNYKGRRAKKPGKRKREPFLMTFSRTLPAIVRRKRIGKPLPLEVLWFFVRKAFIPKDWQFDEAGLRAVEKHYPNAMTRSWSRMKY